MVDAKNVKSYQLKLQATQFLRSTGVLDAYENVIDKLVTTGWPSDKNIFDHAAHELLKWHSVHKDEYVNIAAVNPGTSGLQTAARAREESPTKDFLRGEEGTAP